MINRIINAEGRVAICGSCRSPIALFSVTFLSIFGSALCAKRASAQLCPDEMLRKNRQALVFIQVKKSLKNTGQVDRRTGTGFIISRSGYVLTNKHVVESDDKVDEIEITGAIASREAYASHLIVVGTNQHDVALLKFLDTSKPYEPIALGQPHDIANVTVGTHLCSEGFPMNKEFFFAEGAMSGTGGERGFWLTQMPSNLGDSGAPVFVTSGEVVAIKVGGYGDLQDVNALIPMNLARDLVDTVPDAVPAGDSQNSRDHILDQLTVTSDAGIYRRADFLKFLSGRQLEVIMDSSTATELDRANVKIHTDGFRDVPLRWVLDHVLLPELSGGAEQWTYEIVGKTLLIKRRPR